MEKKKYTYPDIDITGTVDLSNPESVSSAIYAIYEAHYGNDHDNFNNIKKILWFIYDLFNGDVEGFLPCDIRYHDLPHTTGTTLAITRILDGINKSPSFPIKIDRPSFELMVNSGILHDIGYIKEVHDELGTGAKYTMIHVERSINFLVRYLPEQGLDDKTIRKLENIIRCTEIRLEMDNQDFGSDDELMAGHILRTADFISQMSDHNYLEKLPILYEEFVEGGITEFESAEHLIRNTPDFWKNFVLPMLTNVCESMYEHLVYHFGDGRNLYIEGIEKNIMLIEQSLDT